MAILLVRKSNIKKEYKLFKISGTRPDKIIALDVKESILSHLRKLPDKSEVVVSSFKDAFLTQADFKRIFDYIIEHEIHLLFADMSLPEISKEVWLSKEAKPYVDMILAFIELNRKPSLGTKVGPPVLIGVHRDTIISMTKEGASPPEIAKKIGFSRNTVYNYICRYLPELRRDNRLSDSWAKLDKQKKSILTELNKGVTKKHLMQKHDVSLRVFTKWLSENGGNQITKVQLTREDVNAMIKKEASIDAMRIKFHVSPSTMRRYLKENFPDYYKQRSESRNKSEALMKYKGKITKALRSGVTKKEVCEQYNILYTTLSNFLKKIDFQ